jgi:hypothetical protein
MTQRSWHNVPSSIIILLLLSFVLQIAWGCYLPRQQARAETLSQPPSVAAFKLVSGEPVAAAQLSTLYLQAFDNQPGISIPFRNLDYARVSAWLERILELDPRGQYPLLMASQLYAQVPDESRQRQMLAFAYQHFFDDPNQRWPWLAHAAIVAKHRLHDMPLALKYADAIAHSATGKNVPHWAQQMRIFILEEMNETKSAEILLGGLLASGTITDPHEIHFLMERLQALKGKSISESAHE